MDHTRDNPLKRFTSFWFALLLVTTFAIGALILWPLSHGDVETVADLKAADRLQIKAEVQKAQTENLNAEALAEALANAAKAPSQAPSPGSMAVPSLAPESASAEDPAESPEPNN